MTWVEFIDWVDYSTEKEIDEAVSKNRLSYMQWIYIKDLRNIEPRDRIKFLYDRRLPKNRDDSEATQEYIIEL